MEEAPVNMSVTLGSSVVSVASLACAKRGPGDHDPVGDVDGLELVVAIEQTLEAAVSSTRRPVPSKVMRLL